MKVRVYCHAGEQGGYARAAMDLCMALQRTGIQLEIRPLAKPERVRLPEPFLPLARNIGYWTDAAVGVDVVIVHTLPGDCRRVLESIGLVAIRLHRDPRTVRCVAYTTWETAWMTPDVRASLLSSFDDLWMPSAASAGSMGPGIGVQVLPHCYDEATLLRRAAPQLADALPNRPYRFYSIGAWSERKNQVGIVKAFELAFGGTDERVELVMHAPDAPEDALVSAWTAREPSARWSVTLSRGWLPDAEVATMHDRNDCFVSASHGEAWNLPAFDAMLAGRHVIAPAGQGSDEFLEHSSATRYRTGKTKYPTGSRWDANPRAPDLDELATAMRSRAAVLCRDLTLYYDPAERYGYDAVGKLALRYLDIPGAPP